MQVVYQPKGRALEYSELACNLYMGCTHGCKYCFAPACMRKTPEQWHSAPYCRSDVIGKLRKDAAAMANGFTGIMGYASTIVSGLGIAFIKEQFGWDAALAAIACFALAGMALFMLAWNAAPDGYARQTCEGSTR